MKSNENRRPDGMRIVKNQVTRSEFHRNVERINQLLNQLRNINSMWRSFIYTKSEFRNSRAKDVMIIDCACDLLEDVDYDIWEADDVVDVAYELEERINHICKNNIAPSTWRQFIDD